ncbi:3,4-dihydroxy-2-butanone-4-phosphate synthase [Methanonatronarchaeum sp. AMET6-2]|uniref:3,4-dihydroxy-2-butanone-4-phosphate synthase n=1 Tax=Methanonatronarchaeum sp. AMET6-2 TaxID=2933293 RepID=UPI00120BBCC7|nr:3,4-dihydroxy-2-butanone-4-phosphate synthase [Methanonatronarchaeum sp. AMET6-2]RZN62530.1 MAG: 3,4-dihydroxy-2-butanone-4-phosphate synthase [Methanonatronarchaeia archaeon]UOY10187.1 3,4-dihydroxy-2-butanone-4-phosphate synthase [Methanonatronarchaeum sp. AMET6-2]
MKVKKAVQQIRDGKPVLIYDSSDREGETDIIAPAQNITPETILRMRRDGGGLICVAISPIAAEKLELEYASTILQEYGYNFNQKVPYDERSSFSIWVNHRDTYTGITDKDRTKTAREISKAVEKVLNGEKYNLEREFRAPGHVAILRAADGLTDSRMGQTELSIKLAKEAKITPAMALCEMLDNQTGEALSREKAEEYAKKNNMPFLTGSQIKKQTN